MTYETPVSAFAAAAAPVSPALFADPAPIDPGNFLLDVDSYKIAHAGMYPEDLTHLSAYIEARHPWAAPEGAPAAATIDEIVFFGLQVALARLAGPVVTQAMVDEAAPFLTAHGLAPQLSGWQRIVDVHGGHLPVEIAALPEGARVAPGVPQVRIENTDPELPWLVTWLETRLLRTVWYASTVASLSAHVMGAIRERMKITDGTDAGAAFKLHDFGGRGATAFESAALGGLAHLVNALGTDTVPALALGRNVYGAEMAGFSIPASEHSVMTVRGEERECAQMRRILEAHPTGLVACVSDSYDLMRAVRDYWGSDLREAVLARSGTLVIRPDSGDPVEIVPQVIEALMAAFGEEKTDTGYRILPPQVRVIQGDGIDRVSVLDIMEAMMARGLAIGNIAFGMGAGLLQKLDRDSFSYAAKVSAARHGSGPWEPVRKDPVTAAGAKTSKAGRQAAVRSAEGRIVAAQADSLPTWIDALQPVFRDGVILKAWTLAHVRARAWPNAADLAG